MANAAINGLGRIGRAALRIVLDTPELDLVAINGVAAAEQFAYLLKYDTGYGRYDSSVAATEDPLVSTAAYVNGLSRTARCIISTQ